MPKLTDTQAVILSSAAKRDDGAALPLPKSLKTSKETIAKAVRGLLAGKLLQERPAGPGRPSWREGRNGSRIAIAITPAGLKALGVEDGDAAKETKTKAAKAREPEAKRPNKVDAILILLRAADGATIADLQKHTGWQPHSIRAALSGLRKQGISIDRSKDDAGKAVYRSPEA